MSNWRELMSMSKHERRGALVVLLLIALLVALHVVVRFHERSKPVVHSEQVRLFDAATDSAVNQIEHHKKKAKKRGSGKSRRDTTVTRHGRSKQGKSKKGRPASAPPSQRDIDREVPRLP